MADLDVKPKSSTPWWLWLLLLLVALALLFYFLRGRGDNSGQANPNDSTANSTAVTPVGTTQSSFDSVDFNSPNASYDEITDTAISVRGGEKYAIYSLGENLLFGTDKSELQPGADAQLKQIAGSLKKRFGGAVIGVYGRTDSKGDASQNKELGAMRAMSVRNWLINNGGVDSTKVSVRSYGESQPVASNATAAGRQQNRSVEIVAVPESAANGQ